MKKPVMDSNALLDEALKLAARAIPGFMKYRGKTYTFVFDPSRWVYLVYEDMVYLKAYNTKRLAVAKRWLREYLEN